MISNALWAILRGGGLRDEKVWRAGKVRKRQMICYLFSGGLYSRLGTLIYNEMV